MKPSRRLHPAAATLAIVLSASAAWAQDPPRTGRWRTSHLPAPPPPTSDTSTEPATQAIAPVPSAPKAAPRVSPQVSNEPQWLSPIGDTSSRTVTAPAPQRPTTAAPPVRTERATPVDRQPEARTALATVPAELPVSAQPPRAVAVEEPAQPPRAVAVEETPASQASVVQGVSTEVPAPPSDVDDASRGPSRRNFEMLTNDASYEAFRVGAQDAQAVFRERLNHFRDTGIQLAFGTDDKGNGGSHADLRKRFARNIGDWRLSSWSLMDPFTFHKTLVEDIQEIGKLADPRDRVKFIGLLAKMDERIRAHASENDPNPYDDEPGRSFKTPEGFEALFKQLKSDAALLAQSKDTEAANEGRMAKMQVLVHELRLLNESSSTGIKACAEAIHDWPTKAGLAEKIQDSETGQLIGYRVDFAKVGRLGDAQLAQCYRNSAALVQRLTPKDPLPGYGSEGLNTLLESVTRALPSVVGGPPVALPAD